MHDKREEKEVAELQRYLFNGEGRKTWLTDDGEAAVDQASS
jgi:hypothetical protein